VATGAGVLRSDIADHAQLRGLEVKLLGYLRTDALERRAVYGANLLAP
jgi:hypothetical protein